MLVWEGDIHLAAQAMRSAEGQQLMQCRLLAKCGTWPPGRQLGWGHPLVRHPASQLYKETTCRVTTDLQYLLLCNRLCVGLAERGNEHL